MKREERKGDRFAKASPVSRPLADKPKNMLDRFEEVFENSPVMMYVTDLAGTFLEINDSGLKLLGYDSRNEVEGVVSARDVYVGPGERVRFRDAIVPSGAVREFETRLKTRNGEVRDVTITASVRRSEDGAIIGYEGFVVDITQRKFAEKALRESEEKYRTVIENSLTGIFAHRKGIMQFANSRLVEMLDYESAKELEGRPFWDFVHPDDREFVKERGLKREQGEVYPARYDFRILKKDGSVVWVDMRASTAKYMGQPAVIGNLNDITATKMAEEEIRRLSRRLIDEIEDGKKKLASDLHDEFGQALTSLHLSMESLRSAFPEQEERVNGLLKQVEMLADAVRKTTARLRPTMLDHLGLIPALKSLIDDWAMKRPFIQVTFESAGFKKRLTPEIELALYRIVQECLTNISKHASARQVEIYLTFSYPKVILLVIDDGVGFGKKADGSRSGAPRTGIGLPSMRERAASLGGSLEISSAPGKGTRIKALLPAEEY
jgi:PAS domain S-box-containing protein